MAQFVPKRQIDSNSVNKELKRLAAHGNAKVVALPAAVATPNATDLATCQTLANQLKTTLNQLLTSLG